MMDLLIFVLPYSYLIPFFLWCLKFFYGLWSGLQGMCLTKEHKPPIYIVALVDWLRARVIAALLWPLHMLAKILIYKKIHASIGISKVVQLSIFIYSVLLHFFFSLLPKYF